MNKMNRFTQRTRKVLSLAQQEAERYSQNAINTEHVLLALILEQGGVAGKALQRLNIIESRVRALVGRRISKASKPSSSQLDLTPEVKKMLELSVDEARRMGQAFIGTEHFLLALSRQLDSSAIELCKRLGHEPESIREAVLSILGEGRNTVPSKSTETSGQQVKSRDSEQDEAEVDESQSTNVQTSSASTTSTEKEGADKKSTFSLGPPPDYVESLDQLEGPRDKIEPSRVAAEEDEKRDYERYNRALAANSEKRDFFLQHFIGHYLEANEKERAARLLIGNTARQRVILEQFRSYNQYSQELDATIDAYEDPLTPDDMVVVAGLHSARLALRERAATFKDTDLEYMVDVGELNQAISLAILRSEVENQLNGLLQIEERIAQQTEANTQSRLQVLKLAIDTAERLTEPAPQLMEISLRLCDIDSQLAHQTAHDAFRAARHQRNFAKSVEQTLQLAAQTHLETDQIQLLLRQHFDSGINMPDAEKNIPTLIQLQTQIEFSNAEREVVHQKLWSLARSSEADASKLIKRSIEVARAMTNALSSTDSICNDFDEMLAQIPANTNPKQSLSQSERSVIDTGTHLLAYLREQGDSRLSSYEQKLVETIMRLAPETEFEARGTRRSGQQDQKTVLYGLLTELTYSQSPLLPSFLDRVASFKNFEPPDPKILPTIIREAPVNAANQVAVNLLDQVYVSKKAEFVSILSERGAMSQAFDLALTITDYDYRIQALGSLIKNGEWRDQAADEILRTTVHLKEKKERIRYRPTQRELHRTTTYLLRHGRSGDVDALIATSIDAEEASLLDATVMLSLLSEGAIEQASSMLKQSRLRVHLNQEISKSAEEMIQGVIKNAEPVLVDYPQSTRDLFDQFIAELRLQATSLDSLMETMKRLQGFQVFQGDVRSVNAKLRDVVNVMQSNRPAGATNDMIVIVGVLHAIARHGIAQNNAAQNTIEDPFRLHLEHMTTVFAGGHRDFVEPMIMLIAATARNEEHARAFLNELIESPYSVAQELLNTILTETERFLQLGLQAEGTLRVMIAIASVMAEHDDPRAAEALNRTVQVALKHDSTSWRTHLASLRDAAHDVGDTVLTTTIDTAIAQTEATEIEQLRRRLIEQGALLEEVTSSESASTGRNLRFDHGLFLDMMRFSAPISIVAAARLSERTYIEISNSSNFEKITRCLFELIEARNDCKLPSNPKLLYEALKATSEMEQFKSTGRPTFRHQTVLRIINLMKQEQHPNLNEAYTLYGQVLQELKSAVLDGIKNKQAGQSEIYLGDKVTYCKMAVIGLLDLLKEEGTTTDLYTTQVDELIALSYLEHGNGIVGMIVVARDLKKYAPERLDEHMPKLSQALKETGNDQFVKVLTWSDTILEVILEHDDVDLIVEMVPSLSKLVGLSGTTKRIASIPGIIWRKEKQKQAIWAYHQLYVYNLLTGFAYTSTFEKGLWFFQRIWQQSVARKTSTRRTLARLNLFLNIILLPLTLLFAILFLIVLLPINAINKRRKRLVGQSQSKKVQRKQRNERSFQIGLGKMLALHGIERHRAAKRIARLMVAELRNMATEGNIMVKEKWLKEFVEVLDSVGFHEEKQSLLQTFPHIDEPEPKTDTVKMKTLTKLDLVKPVVSGKKRRYLSQSTKWLERTSQQIKSLDELPDELPIRIIAESLRVLAPIRKEYQELFDIVTNPSSDKD